MELWEMMEVTIIGLFVLHERPIYTSESDVCRRQILTYKDGPRTEKIKTVRRPIILYTHNIGIQMNHAGRTN